MSDTLGAYGATPATLGAYHPSWRDRLASWAIGDSRDPVRQNLVQALLGSRGLGSTGMGLVDATPAGIPLAVNESQNAANQGDWTGAAINAMAMIPGAKAGTKALEGAANEVRQGIRAHDAFWTYRASNPTPLVSELPQGVFNGTQAEFESLSPGMRREILRNAERAPKGIKAYHGSPHDFDKFDISKIGTGEGAQGGLFGVGAGPAKVANVSPADISAFEDSVIKRHGLRSLSLFPTASGDLKLNMIAVPKDRQGQGVGTAAMQEITDFADRNGLRLVLRTGEKDDGFGTTSRTRLRSFYKRFGFVENKGRNKDFSVSEDMIRPLAK